MDVEAQLRKQNIAKNKISQRRHKLTLPAPHISDQELEEIAKIGYASDLGGLRNLLKGVVRRVLF